MRFSRTPIVLSLLIGFFARPCAAYPPDPAPQATALMREQKYQEAAAAFEAYLATNRFDSRAWSNYGVCLYKIKQYDRAKEMSQKAIELGANPSGEMYNIACVSALQGRTDEAFAWLTRAFDAGFADQETLGVDTDLDSIRADPRFFALTGLNPPVEASPAAQWNTDLDFLIRRMEQMHWDLYAHISKEDFRAAIETLKAEAPALDFQHAKARLGRIIARVGDGHTTVSTFADGEQSVPRIAIQANIFTDGVFITAAPPDHRDLIGTRITKIGELDIDEAMRRIRPYCSKDNDMTPLTDLPWRLANPAMLQEIGAATESETGIQYTLMFPDGALRTVALTPEPIGRGGLLGAHPDVIRGSDLAPNPKPLYLQDLDTPLWMKHLEAQNAVYFCFQGVTDNPDRSFASIIDDLNHLIEEKSAEYLIIDMRMNTGGNTGLVLPLIHALIKNDRINKPGHLFVIIGRRTFSAAQNTVNLIEVNTSATFVGEPTGSSPNFVGESTYFILPYSRLRIYCSSRYWQFQTSTDKRTWVQPQIAAELSSQDYFTNRDPCMDAILQRLTTTTTSATTAPE